MHPNQRDITQIAGALGRSKSTISRELHRNTRRLGYSAYEAQNSYTLCKIGMQASTEGHETRKSQAYHRWTGAVLVS
jgi:IS30 family transposase